MNTNPHSSSRRSLQPSQPHNPAVRQSHNSSPRSPDESPEESVDSIPIISEEFATRRLIHSYNVRASFQVGFGTHYPIRPLGPRGVTEYSRMTRGKWNGFRLEFDSPQGQDIRNLLILIYSSVLHHQESLVIYGRSSIYALPYGKDVDWSCFSATRPLSGPTLSRTR